MSEAKQLGPSDLYTFVLFNYSGSLSLNPMSECNGKWCIQLNPDNGCNRYLDKNLVVHITAGECWYTLDIIQDMLQKLVSIKCCSCCGKLK